MDRSDWIAFLKGMVLLVLFGAFIGLTIGSCRGVASMVERWLAP